jgi:hypothetical protein
MISPAETREMYYNGNIECVVERARMQLLQEVPCNGLEEINQ